MRPMWIVVCVLLAIGSPAVADGPPTAKELISRGEVLEAKNEFAAALELYGKLEKLPGQLGIAKYLEARVRYLQTELDLSQQLVLAAVAQSPPEPWKFKAKLLYGEILYKRTEYTRAKDVFLELRRQQAVPDRKRELEGRVIACNKALHLADRDGL